MRYLLFVIAFVWGAAVPAQAQDLSIKDVIASQIEAFEADDLETAFSFASPNIQSIFGTPENFGSMVSGSYPMVWRPSDITFLNSENRNGSTWQRLKVTDRQGATFWFIYEMVLIDDKWRINGVFRIDAPGLNA